MYHAFLVWLDAHPGVLFFLVVARVPAFQLGVLLALAWFIGFRASRAAPTPAESEMAFARALRRNSFYSYAALLLVCCLIIGYGLDWAWRPSERATMRLAANMDVFVLLAVLCDVALLVVLGILLSTGRSTFSHFDWFPELRRVLPTLVLSVSIVIGADVIQQLSPGFRLNIEASSSLPLPVARQWVVSCWTLWILLVVPVAEELLFRGLIFASVQQVAGRFAAVAVTAVAFALMHASVDRFLMMLFIGVALGALRDLGRSLAAPIAVHLLINATALIRHWWI